MQNLTQISNNELLDLYTIGNALTRGRLNRGLESDKEALREYRKEIKRRGFRYIKDFRQACADERKAEYEAELKAAQVKSEAQDEAQDEAQADQALIEAEDAVRADQALAEAENAPNSHPTAHKLAEQAGVSVEDVESFTAAIVYRLIKSGSDFSEESVGNALDEYQRDMEIQALNALLEL